MPQHDWVLTVASSDAEEGNAIEQVLQHTKERESGRDPRGLRHLDILLVVRLIVAVLDKRLALIEVEERVEFVKAVKTVGVRNRLSRARHMTSVSLARKDVPKASSVPRPRPC